MHECSQQQQLSWTTVMGNKSKNNELCWITFEILLEYCIFSFHTFPYIMLVLVVDGYNGMWWNTEIFEQKVVKAINNLTRIQTSQLIIIQFIVTEGPMEWASLFISQAMTLSCGTRTIVQCPLQMLGISTLHNLAYNWVKGLLNSSCALKG